MELAASVGLVGIRMFLKLSTSGTDSIKRNNMAKITIDKHISGLKFLEAELIFKGEYGLSDHIRAFWKVLDFLALDPRVPDSVIDRILEDMELS